MGKLNGECKAGKLFGPRCGKPATHWTWIGLRCAGCAELLRQALRNPNTVVNVLARRARTEEEIARFVKELQ